jgi:hypothetical protein
VGTAPAVINEYAVDPFKTSIVIVFAMLVEALLQLILLTIPVPDDPEYIVVAAVEPKIVPKLLYVSGIIFL